MKLITIIDGTPSEIAEFMDKQCMEDALVQRDKVSFIIPYRSYSDMLKEAEFLQQSKKYEVGGQL
ncbi:hypothetical protein [Anaerotignum propionicum]|uniref:Uncharacterized protein n=1 Tax=Anaerotignum propionicum DSM 1682 TaxID=991789 RepID=A0A0X1U6V1_ANAPI|nr:hypothetical protein [Anaerotignum propionicum]AMJ40676.1 hypothetical protein CPRO_10810 [Anaerotignum propionicum DSM 1682]SHE90333.1 hypothetical protein SAMN02745151_02148 [[Clostridium] propionicum DSM 1682] [Anaerotignum propionicum DSM 1682]